MTTRSIVFRHDNPIGRLPILHVSPVVDEGRWPAKAFAGEVVPFAATVFREGHDALGVELLLTSPKGEQSVHRMTAGAPGTDRWSVEVWLKEQGEYKFQIRAFSDEFETWHHNASVKIAVGMDEDLMMLEGVRLLTRAAKEKGRTKTNAKTLVDLAEALADASKTAAERLALADFPAVVKAIAAEPIRAIATLSAEYVINSERKLAGCGAWYEFFPRSEGAVQNPDGSWTSGNFVTARNRLMAVKDMGFDILYMPPIHPIGKAYRKGPNNTLDAGPNDPGSPWAIGGADGGHDAIHPDLGSVEDFLGFVDHARSLGIEIALDFALQASPDHPWVKAHPEWFTTRADGSIAYAENPPKKYQDIYPINFDNDPVGIYHEALRVLRYWIGLGIKIFRVDNPHTKPVNFWEWIIAEVNTEYPDVIFLAEAFTRPSMMHALGRVGYQQSYTYYTWRNSKPELEAYINEVAHQSANFFRPNFWVSTPDILTEYLQFGGKPAHMIRAAIAATATPNWGMYAGYELVESVARPGAEEHINSEKYEFKARDWESAATKAKSIAPYISKLNQIRRENPALQQLRNVATHWSDDPAILVYSKHLDGAFTETGKSNTIVVVANLDPHAVRATTVHLDLSKLGLDYGANFEVTDLLSGDVFSWSSDNYVKLDAFVQPVHILRVSKIK